MAKKGPFGQFLLQPCTVSVKWRKNQFPTLRRGELLVKASYTWACRMVCKPLANRSWIKCAYVWTGLQTCAAPSANSSHTIRCEPKFVGFSREHKENWMRIHAPGVLCLPQVRGKVINHAAFALRTSVFESEHECVRIGVCGAGICSLQRKCNFIHIGVFTELGILAYAAINRRSSGHLRIPTDACGNAK